MKNRLMGGGACIIVALDCFAKDGGELLLPYWMWAAVGVAWLINALAVFVDQGQPA